MSEHVGRISEGWVEEDWSDAARRAALLARRAKHPFAVREERSLHKAAVDTLLGAKPYELRAVGSTEDLRAVRSLARQVGHDPLEEHVKQALGLHRVESRGGDIQPDFRDHRAAIKKLAGLAKHPSPPYRRAMMPSPPPAAPKRLTRSGRALPVS